MERIKKEGFVLEKEGNVILSISRMGRKIAIDQEVVSNGRIFIRYGVKGRVAKIFEPFIGGRTDNVIRVGFSETMWFDMKFKDLL